MSWGIKVANFCQEVLNPLCSYTQVLLYSIQGPVLEGQDRESSCHGKTQVGVVC